MPRMNGDELLSRLDGVTQATRILVTGFADLTAVIRAVNEGRIFAYVAKPWQPDDLRLKVQRAAEHFRLAKDLADERRLLHDLMDNVPDGISSRTTSSATSGSTGRTPPSCTAATRTRWSASD